MTQAGSVYGEALYTLACEEALSKRILQQLLVLTDSFAQIPEFLKLLNASNLTKAERCRILDNCFRGKLHPHVLNFLKLLTEKGHIRQFDQCVQRYRELYEQDNRILPITAVTAVAMTKTQTADLVKKLQTITEKRIELTNRQDPTILGGIRLDYDGKRVDGTIAHRLEVMRDLLKNTPL